MVMVEIGQHRFSMDGYLFSNCQAGKKMLRDDNDLVIIIDGGEGSGKSVLAQQVATTLDPTFNINRITFTPRAFMQAVKDAQKYEAVIYDEAFSGLINRTSLTWTNLIIVKMLAEVRQKNLALIIVAPTFFDLDRYVALWRSRFLINVYRGKQYERGYFRFFSFEKKKDLFVDGRQRYNYLCTKPDFYGRFSNYYTVNEHSYRQLKYQALVNRKDNLSPSTRMTDKLATDWVLRRIAVNRDIDQVNLSSFQRVLGMKQPTFWAALRKMREQLGVKQPKKAK